MFLVGSLTVKGRSDRFITVQISMVKGNVEKFPRCEMKVAFS